MARKVYIIVSLALALLFCAGVALHSFLPFIVPGTYITARPASKERILKGNNEPAEETGRLKIGEKININTAGEEELEQLPGIGPALAKAVVEYRQANGNFKETSEIMNVSGIGEGKYSAVKDLITVD